MRENAAEACIPCLFNQVYCGPFSLTTTLAASLIKSNKESLGLGSTLCRSVSSVQAQTCLNPLTVC